MLPCLACILSLGLSCCVFESHNFNMKLVVVMSTCPTYIFGYPYLLHLNRAWREGLFYFFPCPRKMGSGGIAMSSSGAGIEWMVQEQILASSRQCSTPKQFWEQGWYQNIFG